MQGKFLTIEGAEGVGKTTNIDFIRQYLTSAGIDFIATREPGGTPLAEKIRELLLDAKQTAVSADTELLMMFAARAQHLAEKILPALEKGQWVICDRFTDATYAYQGGGRGIDTQRIAQLETWVQGSLRPDLTLLLDVPVELGLERAGNRSEPDRFEREKIDFFQRVRACYLERAAQEPQRFRVVDAARDLIEVQARIKQVLDEVIGA
ncbi:MAG: dTMP kinase [Gammaproteobacteria bacterium]|nr:dTMP kinase [Gammaproteobacteria bacterium]MDH5652683.1 dTMP kinase [Gammaproteobacteria bacterium]